MISTIIPTYNRVEYLKSALNCVLSQTVPSNEIIIVDDGSTDSTYEFIQSVSKQHPQIVYIRQPNRGEGAARNRGILEARNRIIAFLDSDDTWEPLHIEDSIECLSLFPDAGFLFAKYELQDLQGRISNDEVSNKYQRRDLAIKIAIKNTGSFFLLDSEKCFYHVLRGNIGFSNSTLVINLDKCPRNFMFDENLKIGVDDDFRLQLLAAGVKMAYIDKVHSEYVIHETNQVTTKTDSCDARLNKLHSVIHHAEKKLIYCNTAEDYNDVYAEIANKYYNIGSHLNDIGNYDDAIKWYKLSCTLKRRMSILKHVVLYKLVGSQGYSFLYRLLNKK